MAKLNEACRGGEYAESAGNVHSTEQSLFHGGNLLHSLLISQVMLAKLWQIVIFTAFEAMLPISNLAEVSLRWLFDQT